MFTVVHESDSYGLHRIRGGAWAVEYVLGRSGWRYAQYAELCAVESELHRALEQGADTVGFVMQCYPQLSSRREQQVQWITITHCLLDTENFSVHQYWNHVKHPGYDWAGTVLYLDQSAAQRWADLANQLIFWSRLSRPQRVKQIWDLT